MINNYFDMKKRDYLIKCVKIEMIRMIIYKHKGSYFSGINILRAGRSAVTREYKKLKNNTILQL